jgi:hypothetical protein
MSNRSNRAGLAANADTIYWMHLTRFASQAHEQVDPALVPSVDDVRDALAFLSSKAVGVLREAGNGGGMYRLVMHFDTAMKKITALSRALEDSDARSKATALSAGSDRIRPG